ncbi:MAG: cobalamin-dependent protein [Candidatus Hydrogenedentes bacterium]|nr:cobalamin-dependent protein [Candidatus Hydrogenedentota bacterium]
MGAGAGRPKRRVYFNEYNVLMDGAAYLPLVSGILRAYGQSIPRLDAQYEWMPFLFMRDTPEVLAALHEAPDVAVFSSSMWNEQLNLHVAAAVKERHPECLIVFGGAQVPHHPEKYFQEHPYIDVAVRGEGERPFTAILERYLESADFSDIPNVAWRDRATGACVTNPGEFPLEKNLDLYPSPYLAGLFDYIFDEHADFEMQAIIETNRGCPFLCAFCFWGQGGLSLKFRYHGLDRVREEIEWCAQHRIRYMFNADSNFGMHKRDVEIAEILVATKEKYGYPEKFRTCFGKNTDERIFSIGLLLHKHGMEKGITLSRQSMDDQVLENIDRKNIKMETYRNLQVKFTEQEVPVYTELILGLAGETYEGWRQGIETLLQSGLKNQLFVYLCQVFPNTTMNEPEHREKFGIETSRIDLTEIHGSIRPAGSVPEYEHVVVATKSLPPEDWRRALIFSWTTMAFHSLKLGFFLLMYLADRFNVRYTDVLQYLSEGRMPEGVGSLWREELARFHQKTEDILSGRGRGCELRDFGDIYWDVEEACLLHVSGDLDRFYEELHEIIKAFLGERRLLYDADELTEAVAYQRMRMSSWHKTRTDSAEFQYNFPEYFEHGYRGRCIPLKQVGQGLSLPEPKDFQGDKTRFARETILWGRKNDRILESVAWTGPQTVPSPAHSQALRPHERAASSG